MAQQDDIKGKTSANTSTAPRPQNSPGSKSSPTQTSPNGHRLHGGGSSFSPNSSSKPKHNEQDDHVIHHNKKSVFSKVKEKARKLKKSISSRKRREENDSHSPYITPPGSAGAVVDDDNKDESECFGTPVYEPQESNKASSKKPDSSKIETPTSDSNKSKQSGLAISTHEDTNDAKRDSKEPDNNLEAKENSTSNAQQQDRGVSVKEYIMHKLEPGEDERALSQVITQTISPKCEKMKEAVNSLLRNEEASDLTSKNTNLELDMTPSSSTTESNDHKLSSLTNYTNLSNTRESNLSNASNMSQCSTTTSDLLQDQNLDLSTRTSSNLKPS